MRKSLIVRIAIVIVFLGLGLATTAQAQSDAGLVAEWHFDEGSGNILKDSSGNGNDGTIYGATWTTGISGKALSFDGVDDYVDLGNALNFGTSDFSVEAWIKVEGDSIKSYQTIISDDYGPWTLYSFEVRESDGHPFIVLRDNEKDGLVSEGSVSLRDNKLHHIVAVRDGTRAYLYVDGSFVDSDENENLGAIDSGHNDWIGYKPDNNGAFNGIIDEIRIYNRALSAEEIKAHYDALTGSAPAAPPMQKPTVSTVSDEGLLAEWHFDEGSATVLRDSSGYGNDGTIHGATWTTGISGTALQFDGVNDHVVVPESPLWDFRTGDFTVSFWFMKLNTARGWAFSFGSGLQNNLCFDFDDPDAGGWGAWVYWMSGGAPHVRTKNTYYDGNWHYLSFTRTGNIFELYIDGNPIAQTADSSDIEIIGDVYIGAFPGGSGYLGASYVGGYFKGLIDEVRIYNRALSASEIKAQYETPGASAPASTVTPTPTSAISYPSTVEAPTATPSAEAQARNSRLMLYGLIGAIGVVGIVIAVKVGGNVASKARVKKDEKMREQQEREEYERKIKEWEDQGYVVSEMKEELKK